MRRLRLLAVASGAGAPDQGCAAGPQVLRRHPAFQAVAAHVHLDWVDLRSPGSGHTAFESVLRISQHLADEVRETLATGALPLVIGGDHSIAIGTWSGVRLYLGEAGAPGLLWIDAHLDSHTPQTSPSGALHGMPLACLLGEGEPRLVDLGGVAPKLDAHSTALVGARSYEPEELERLARHGVRVFGAAQLRWRGFATCLAEGLVIARRAPGGWGISIDLDCFDPACAPGVGSAVADGPQPEPVLRLLRTVRDDPSLLAVEIVEYNPARDQGGRTAALVAALVGALLPG